MGSIASNLLSTLDEEGYSPAAHGLKNETEILNPYEFDIYELEARLFYYHALARALECGSGTRPGLPVEIVLIITQLSDCVVPSKSLSISTNLEFLVQSSGQTEVKQIWLTTEPFTRESLSSIVALRASTVSCNQGWVDNPNAGNYSWFDIAVGRFKPQPLQSNLVRDLEHLEMLNKRFVPSVDDLDRPIQWRCHYNALKGREEKRCEGVLFSRDHEIWDNVKEGDVLVLQGCAQYSGWECRGSRAEFIFWKYFVPTLVPRSTI